jgi:hypothetical protein
MHVQELCQRYPNVDQIISLGNENREHSPEIARICDYIAGLTADLIQYLPAPPAPVVAVAPVARFDPYTGQPIAPAPAPAQYTSSLNFGGASVSAPEPAPAPANNRAELLAALQAIMAKL